MAFDSHSNFVEIQKLKKELNAKSGNLVRYDISQVATVDGQTQFPIDLSTFNHLTDSVLVQSGRTLLSPSLDYTVMEHSVVLNEGVPLDRTVDIYVYQNVANLDEEQTISGLQIAEGSIPLNRLAASVGGQMKLYTEMKIATEDGQTEFKIDLETFVASSDTILVQEGTQMLFPNEDFTVSKNIITLSEGVQIGCTVGVYIFKQIEHTDINYFISGLMIEPNSIPLDRLAEPIKVDVTADIPMHLSIGEDGGVQIKYTGLLYNTIECLTTDGNQYFNTGFIPNQNTRVVMRFRCATTEEAYGLLGVRNGASSNAYTIWLLNGIVQSQYGNVAYNTNPITMDYAKEVVYDFNKNVVTVNGSEVTFAEATFTPNLPLYLLTINDNGTADSRCALGDFVDCQIYDNGTLVHDYISVLDARGVACAYDKVSNEFLYNAGTGNFIAGVEL